ncbi:helix-turn-helix domain-containing protein [Streptomyces sp. NPDC047315]|uniref:helix-turn-helix domain-containing protein n=1 Tax=Streptomyces sp. NPDC047315 TaxID=3155142 RepID=UPI0033E58DE7
MTVRLPLGKRVVRYRRRTGRSQAAIAGLVGISERYLSQIENGHKTPSADVLTKLAAELGVPVAALLAEEPVPQASAPLTVAPEVARALLGYGPCRTAEPVAPAALRERVENAWQTWQSSPQRFTDIADILPALIQDTEHAVRARRRDADATARRETLRVAADLYGLLRSYCRRAGRLDLSLMVADRARQAAEDADDPIRIAAAAWNLGHALLADPRGETIEEAGEVAQAAVAELRRAPAGGTPDALAMQGALELVSVVSDARRQRWWQARDRLEKTAVPLAKQAGEGNVGRTVFGPTNIILHAISIEMLAGEAAEALRLADLVDTSALASHEREFTFTMEVARCCAIRRDDAAVLVHLLRLEELSAEDLVRSPAALLMLADLQKRARPSYRRPVDQLAERLGV